MNSIDYVLRFLKKLCRSLHCENLFSDQPISQHSGGSYPSDGLSVSPTTEPALMEPDKLNYADCFVFFLSLAETSMTENYDVNQTDGKRYSVDHGDSAFSSISSSYTPKSSYGFRSSQKFSNGSASMSLCRQSSTSPNSFPDGNRTGDEAL